MDKYIVQVSASTRFLFFLKGQKYEWKRKGFFIGGCMDFFGYGINIVEGFKNYFLRCNSNSHCYYMGERLNFPIELQDTPLPFDVTECYGLPPSILDEAAIKELNTEIQENMLDKDITMRRIIKDEGYDFQRHSPCLAYGWEHEGKVALVTGYENSGWNAKIEGTYDAIFNQDETSVLCWVARHLGIEVKEIILD